MATKLTVTKIVLTPKDGKDVTLTVEEARDLYNQLAELFAPRLAPQVPIVIEREVLPLPWRPYQPYWMLGTPDQPVVQPYVTCSTPSGLQTRYVGDVVDDQAST